MKRNASSLAAACIVFVLTAGGVFAQTTPAQGAAQAPNAEEQVRAANQQLVEASRASDKDAARRLMAEGMSWVDGRGVLQTRDQLIEGTPNPPREVIIDRVKMLGGAAVVTGSARFDTGLKVRFLQEWVNRDGAWRLYAHQATAPSLPAQGSGTAGTSGRAPKGSVAPSLRSDEERAVWKAQTELHRAYLAGDVESYSNFTADDYFRVEENGEERVKSEFLQEVKANGGQSKRTLEMGDVQVAVTGDTARLVATLWGTGPDGQPNPPTRVTRVFVNRNGRWQQAAAVFTTIAQQ